MKINYNPGVNFKSKSAPLKDTWIAKCSIKFTEIGGERATNLINALGKGTIAPLFIAFNPFSKEDKETKTYSAWKHPIEAGVTFGIQMLVLKNIDKYLSKLSKAGKLSVDINLKGLAENSAQWQTAEKRLGVFKDRIGFLGALAVIPIATSLVNYVYPKIMKKLLPNAHKTDEVENL